MYSTLDGKIGTRWGVNMYTKRSFNKGYGVGGGGHVKGGILRGGVLICCLP